MENSHILPIICTVAACNVQIGTQIIPSFADPIGMTLEDFGIVDAKCDNHK